MRTRSHAGGAKPRGRNTEKHRLAEERKQPECLYYLSFATGYGFLGAAVVRAHGILTAQERCRELKIHPGGECLCWRIDAKDEHRVPADLRDRLLTAKEVIERLDGMPI